MDLDTLAIVGVLGLLVRAGHTLHTMGAVRARSVAAVAARALIGTASITLIVWVAGHAIGALYDDPDTPGVQGPGVFVASASSFLQVLPLALLPAALVGGATAERARVRGLFLVVAVVTALALPTLTGAGWSAINHLDVPIAQVSQAWPLVVAHLLAATAALTLARVIGPRAGKYNRDGSANFIPAHSLPTMIGGDLLLVLGIPMMAAAIAGDPAARTINAALAASAATLGAVAAVTLRDGRVDVMQPWSGALAGLVAGSLCAPQVPWVAIALGGTAGAVLPWCSLKTDLKLRIDETAGLALPHLLGGLAGALGAGVGSAMESDATWRDVLTATGVSVGGAVVVIVVGAIATLVPALLLRRVGWLRVSPDAEVEGLDLSQHDINAYPDFQQTMIKSYHLRQ